MSGSFLLPANSAFGISGSRKAESVVYVRWFELTHGRAVIFYCDYCFHLSASLQESRLLALRARPQETARQEECDPHSELSVLAS